MIIGSWGGCWTCGWSMIWSFFNITLKQAYFRNQSSLFLIKLQVLQPSLPVWIIYLAWTKFHFPQSPKPIVPFHWYCCLFLHRVSFKYASLHCFIVLNHPKIYLGHHESRSVFPLFFNLSIGGSLFSLETFLLRSFVLARPCVFQDWTQRMLFLTAPLFTNDRC